MEKSDGRPKNISGITAVKETRPEIVLWYPDINLDYLVLISGLGEGEPVDFSASPADKGALVIQPKSALEQGGYCLVKGDPLGSPVDLPYWCFFVGEKPSALENKAAVAAQETPTVEPTPTRSPADNKIFFLTGHNELSFNSSAGNRAYLAGKAIKDLQLTAEALNLSEVKEVPAGKAILIAAPQLSLTEQEVAQIKAFQERGGSIVYLIDPPDSLSAGDTPDPMAAYLAENWNILVDEDLIVDPSSSQPLYAIVQQFNSHPITDKISSLAIVLPGARSIREGDNRQLSDIEVTQIALTSKNAWGETDYSSIQSQQMKLDQGKDFMGPVSVAAAAENKKTGAKIVVVGDGDFINDQVFNSYGNRDLFKGMIDWIVE